MKTWTVGIAAALLELTACTTTPEPTAHDIAAELADRINVPHSITPLDSGHPTYGPYLSGNSNPTSTAVLQLLPERCVIGAPQCAAIIIVEDRDPDEVREHARTWAELAKQIGDTRTQLRVRDQAWLILDEVRSNDPDMTRFKLASTFGGEEP